MGEGRKRHYNTLNQIYTVTHSFIYKNPSLKHSNDGVLIDLYEELNKTRLLEIDLTHSNPSQVCTRFINFLKRISSLAIEPLYNRSSLFPRKMILTLDLLFEAMVRYVGTMLYGVVYHKNDPFGLYDQILFFSQALFAKQNLKLALSTDSNLRRSWNVKFDQLQEIWKVLDDSENEIIWSEMIGIEEVSRKKNFDENTLSKWFYNSNFRNNLLSDLTSKHIDKMAKEVEKERRKMEENIVYEVVVVVVVILVVVPLNLASSFFMASSLKTYVSCVQQNTEAIEEEKKKTEKIVHEILPKSIALQLKSGNKMVAEEFDSVSILFSDIANFGDLTETGTPFTIVNILNDIYSFIDSLIVSYDVYKVSVQHHHAMTNKTSSQILTAYFRFTHNVKF